MMRPRIDRCLAAFAAALGLFAAGARADEEKLDPKDLPKAVLKAASAKFAKAEIKGASKEVEDGETTYEVEMTLDGKSVDVAMKADGSILEIEREIDADDLPKAVKKALAKKYPKSEIEKVESITKGEDGPVRFEVAFKAEVVFTAKGKVVGADEDEDDDDKPAAKSKKKKDKDDDGDDDDDDDDDMKEKKDGKPAVKAKKDKDEHDEEK